MYMMFLSNFCYYQVFAQNVYVPKVSFFCLTVVQI